MSSNDITRINLATALGTVAGITGYVRRPRAIKPGDAWPQWGGSERDDGRGFIETWKILVVLPADEATADTFADAKQAALIAALSPILYVDSFAPANFTGDSADMLAVVITGRCE